MQKSSNIQIINLLRKVVFFALVEQVNTDPTPLKELLINLLESTPKSDYINIAWLKNEKALEILHNLLKKNEYIICDFEYFKNLFYGKSSQQDKIAWQANLNELVYLIARLREEGIIPQHKNPHVLLKENFVDKYNKPLKPSSLRSLLEKGIRNLKRIALLDNIINNLLSDT